MTEERLREIEERVKASEPKDCYGPFMPAPWRDDLYGPLACEQHGIHCLSPEVRESMDDVPMSLQTHADLADLTAEVRRLQNELRESWKAGDWARAEATEFKGKYVVKKMHARSAAQTLIAEVGASGSMSVEDAAERAVAEVRRLRARLDDADEVIAMTVEWQQCDVAEYKIGLEGSLLMAVGRYGITT